MQTRKIRQRELFDDRMPVTGPVLRGEIRTEVLQLLTQWLYAVSEAMIRERSDEQDRR